MFSWKKSDLKKINFQETSAKFNDAWNKSMQSPGQGEEKSLMEMHGWFLNMNSIELKEVAADAIKRRLETFFFFFC